VSPVVNVRSRIGRCDISTVYLLTTQRTDKIKRRPPFSADLFTSRNDFNQQHPRSLSDDGFVERASVLFWSVSERRMFVVLPSGDNDPLI
jgi:hypothetical protein